MAKQEHIRIQLLWVLCSAASARDGEFADA